MRRERRGDVKGEEGNWEGREGRSVFTTTPLLSDRK